MDTTGLLERLQRLLPTIRARREDAPSVWEDAGRVFMGRAPTAPMF